MFEALWKLLLRDKTNVYVFTVLRFEIRQICKLLIAVEKALRYFIQNYRQVFSIEDPNYVFVRSLNPLTRIPAKL